MARSFTRTPNTKTPAQAPQTTDGDKQAFDARPKVGKEPRHYDTQPHTPAEPEPKLLDDEET
jgi:hypothetical protein